MVEVAGLALGRLVDLVRTREVRRRAHSFRQRLLHTVPLWMGHHQDRWMCLWVVE